MTWSNFFFLRCLVECKIGQLYVYYPNYEKQIWIPKILLYIVFTTKNI